MLGYIQSYQLNTYLPDDGREKLYRRPKIHHNYGGKLPVWQCFTCGFFPNQKEDLRCGNCDRGFMPSWECYCLQVNACGIEPTCTRCGVLEGCAPSYTKTHDIIKTTRVNVHAASIRSTATKSIENIETPQPGDECRGSWTVYCTKQFRCAVHEFHEFPHYII